MTETTLAPGVKPKKSVALSGVLAGNTALCTVGRSGNDLHYRGYDILDFAETSEFEEIAHLLIHGALPNKAQLKAYKTKLKALRGLPSAVKSALETVPAAAHPMDVMRTGVSALGCALPEAHDHNHPGARDTSPTGWWPLWGPCCCTGTISARTAAASRSRPTTRRSAGHFLHLLQRHAAVRGLGVRANAHLADPVRRA